MSTATGHRELPRVGRYELLGCLATGGMAEIFLGRLRGPSGFERPVVVKRILPHLAKRRVFVEMFLDEARIVAQIRHPNVVQVQELGSEGGELFLVMEYLEGESLAALVRRLTAAKQRLDPRIGAHLVAEACAGLHAAHEITDDDGATLGLVHRDVTPQNVFILYSGQVKLLDFGIAKAADRVARTETGQVKGKFAYMSPEQCRAEPLDRRSDVFALGVLLHEITTGKRLFQRANDLLVLKAICEEPIARPSQLVPGYPAALDAICMTALSRSRGQRYATAAEMRKDLLAAIRTFPGSDEPAEALAAQMGAIFPERIAEKRELLRRVRSGVVVTHVPAADGDEAEAERPAGGLPSLDKESATEAAVSGTSPRVARSGATPPPRGARRGWVLLLAVASVLALLGVAFGFRDRLPFASLPDRAEPARPASPTTTAAADLPTAEPAPAATGSASAIPGEVVVHLETTPPGARVLIAGKDQGVSPLELHLPRSADPVAVTILRDGFAPTTERVVPDVDQRLRLTLVASGHRPRAKQDRLDATAAPTAAPAPSSGFGRFD